MLMQQLRKSFVESTQKAEEENKTLRVNIPYKKPRNFLLIFVESEKFNFISDVKFEFQRNFLKVILLTPVKLKLDMD